MLKFYTGWQWLLIDAANHLGQNKLTFEQRIAYIEAILPDLENITPPKIKDTPLYIKGVMAIRKAQKGIATGHIVHVDASSSGIQIMSVLSRCEKGARASGLIDPDVRPTAYKDITNVMNNILKGQVKITDEEAKEAGMTTMYGSKAVPKRLFGEDTPELAAFYKALIEVAPGAWEVLQDLLSSWQPYALSHEFKLPDGFDARIKVMEKQKLSIEVDELDHASFTYKLYENVGTKTGLSLAANVVHAIDGYIVREMHRRCNYSEFDVQFGILRIEHEMKLAILRKVRCPFTTIPEIDYYLKQYERSGVVNIAILPYISADSIINLPTKYLYKLVQILKSMLQYKPFEIVTVHDSFASHANNVNWVRWNYKEIMAEIAESNLLNDILTQINGIPCKFNMFSQGGLADKIRKSAYALT